MYELVLIPVVVAVLAQIVKLTIDGIPNNLNWQHLLNDYGGMPSAHAAFVSSLATVVGLSQGFDSAVFTVSLALAVIVIRDAVGFRREIGRNAVFTNMLAKLIYANSPTQTKKKLDFLNERVGHSVLEVIIGLIFGICLSLIIYAILPTT